MHRIGRTGRAEEEGQTILFFTEEEKPHKEAIEMLMDYEIPLKEIPDDVDISSLLIPDEMPKLGGGNYNRNTKLEVRGPAFHEKLEKNKKVNQGGSYQFKGKKYKKPQTRGDKIMNRKSKRK